MHKGDEVVVVIKKARPISNTVGANSAAAANKGICKHAHALCGRRKRADASTAIFCYEVRRGDVRHAIIVRTKKEQRRSDGRFIRFDDNAGVLLNNKVS